jgi:hypothetical protein
MLENALSLSFLALEEDDINLLGLISRLSPVRKYYPLHLRSMESVNWHRALPPLAQDDRFARYVEHILDQARNLIIFDSKGASVLERLNPHHEGDEKLRYKAEYFSQLHLFSALNRLALPEDTHVLSRGSLNAAESRERECRAFEISALVHQWPASLNASSSLWGCFMEWGSIGPEVRPLCGLDNMRLWLSGKLGETWMTLFTLCRRAQRSDTPYLAVALSVIAFCQQRGPEIARTLFAIAILNRSGQLDSASILPAVLGYPYHRFELPDGSTVENTEITRLAQDHYSVPYVDNISLSDEARRITASMYRQNLQTQANLIAAQICRQWPRPSIDVTVLTEDYSLINMKELVRHVSSHIFGIRYPNYLLKEFVRHLQRDINFIQSAHHDHVPLLPSPPASLLKNNGQLLSSSDIIDYAQLLSRMPQATPHATLPGPSERLLDGYKTSRSENHSLADVRSISDRLNGIGLATEYASDLQRSISAFEDCSTSFNRIEQNSQDDDLRRAPTRHVTLEMIRESMQPRNLAECALNIAGLWPQFNAQQLLSELSYSRRKRLLPETKQSLISFAEGLVMQQKSRRLEEYSLRNLISEYAKEQSYQGGEGWNAEQYPDWLLIQVWVLIIDRTA